MKKSPSPSFASVKSPISLPSCFSIGASTMRPTSGIRQARIRSSQLSAPGPFTVYFANPEISMIPTFCRTFFASSPTVSKSVERRQENSSLNALGREPKRLFQPPGHAELRALRLQQIVDRCGFQRSRGRQFFVREPDREAAAVVFLHLGVGIGQRRPVAVARHIHRENIKARIAVDHPVGQRQTDTAALTESRPSRRRPTTGRARP